MKRKLRALLFDLDGTLVDTGELHYQATLDALAQLGRTISRTAYEQHVHGNNNADIVTYLFPGGNRAVQGEYVALKETLFRRSLGAARPLPGVAELLDWADARGIRSALVTNAPAENKDVMLRAIGLEGRFDPVVLGDDLARGKPHPLPYLTALERLGVAAGDAIGFDDSVHGIAAVHRAGLYGVGLTTGLPADRLRAAGADLCVPDFRASRLLRELERRL